MLWLRKKLTGLAERLWYDRKFPLRYLLMPLCWGFRIVVWARRMAYSKGLLRIEQLACPVIVVGNITVGGTGKTPMVIWLAEMLKNQGYRPGIISRGYGGNATEWPVSVTADSTAGLVGDEAVVIARRSGCPVSVGPDRVAAARQLLDRTDCDVIISDDGLQHYRLGRNMEIAVIDGVRRFGNGCCLPAGPLREPLSRLNEVDYRVSNGLARQDEYSMRLDGDSAARLDGEGQPKPLASFAGTAVHAVAGIGNPRRFFDYLRRFRLTLKEHGFPDHYQYAAGDLSFEDNLPLIMTEKDGVKCLSFATPDFWYVPITACLDDALAANILARLKEV